MLVKDGLLISRWDYIHPYMGRVRISEMAKAQLERAAEISGSTQRELATMFILDGSGDVIQKMERINEEEDDNNG